MWNDDKAQALQNDFFELTLKSGQYGRGPAERIVIGISDKNNKIATGSYPLGENVFLSFTDASKLNYSSRDNSGDIVVTKYLLAGGSDSEWIGFRRLLGVQGSDWVEGTFSGIVEDQGGKSHVITDGTFSVPVKVYKEVKPALEND